MRLAIFRTSLDPQDPVYLDALRKNNWQKTIVVASVFFCFCLISSGSVYVFSRSHLSIVMAGSLCGFLFVAAYAIRNYRQWKESQTLQTQMKPKYKLLELDGFEKVESHHELFTQTAQKSEEVVSTSNLCLITQSPKEILQSIFVWLEPSDLGHVSKTCKLFRNIVNEPAFLILLIKKDFNLELSGSNLKEEYRRRISYRKLIYTRYRCLIEDFRAPICFQEKLLLSKKDALETVNKTVIVELESSRSTCQCINSMIFKLRDSTLDVYDKDYKYQCSLMFDQRDAAYLEGSGISGLKIICALQKVIVTVYLTIYVWDDTNGQLLAKKLLGNVRIISALSMGNQLLLVTEDRDTKVRNLQFYTLDPLLQLNREIKDVGQYTFISTCCVEGKTFLKMICQKAGEATKIDIYESKQLAIPYKTFSLPKKAKFLDHPSAQYIYFDEDDKTEVWDIFLETHFVIPYQSKKRIAPPLTYKNFLIFATAYAVGIFDLTVEKFRTIMERPNGGIKWVDILSDKLLVTVDYGFNKLGLEVFDFGNFE